MAKKKASSKKSKKGLKLGRLYYNERYERAVEKELNRLFYENIFKPLIKDIELPKKKLQNSKDPLLDALNSGRLVFYKGKFVGDLNASLTSRLKEIGAKWDFKEAKFKLSPSRMPDDIAQAAKKSYKLFRKDSSKLSKTLARMQPGKMAAQFDATKIISSAIYNVDEEINYKLKANKLAVQPKLTKEQRTEIARKYNKNMEKYINNFSKKEIKKLRSEVSEYVKKGGRTDDLAKMIRQRYKVSKTKSQFLARQETKLYLNAVKETRLGDAGVNKYIWHNVVGSPGHPVRPDHKKLDKTVQRYDRPPIVDSKTGRRGNPGDDFNCRCWDEPYVEF